MSLAAALVVWASCTARAQAPTSPPTPPALPQFILSFDASGFIPFSQSYRLNYQSRLAGLPIEIAGSLGFPVNSSLSSSLEVRYRRRNAMFLDNFSISQVEITPGVRVFLEKEHQNDLRLWGSAGLLLAESTASGTLQATHDGSSPTNMNVSKAYYNLGLAIGLGLEYPVTRVSGVYVGLRIGVYLLDPVSRGGLGDAGGVSLGLGYRYSIF